MFHSITDPDDSHRSHRSHPVRDVLLTNLLAIALACVVLVLAV
jgi:hypothetical protein